MCVCVCVYVYVCMYEKLAFPELEATMLQWCYGRQPKAIDLRRLECSFFQQVTCIEIK